MGPFNSHHQPGTRYSYRYKTLTTLDDRRTATGEATAKVSLAADVDAEAVWSRIVGDQKLIRFEVCSNIALTTVTLFFWGPPPAISRLCFELEQIRDHFAQQIWGGPQEAKWP